MGIQVCKNQGASTFWGPERGYILWEILGIWKLFLSQTTGPNELIFGMKKPWDKRVQIKSSWVIYVPPQGGLVLFRSIYMYITNSLDKNVFSWTTDQNA